MRFTTVLASAALYFAAGSDAWAQAADGRWIANDRTYWLEGCMSRLPLLASWWVES
jgi:hypothetical protein